MNMLAWKWNTNGLETMGRLALGSARVFHLGSRVEKRSYETCFLDFSLVLSMATSTICLDGNIINVMEEVGNPSSSRAGTRAGHTW